MNAGRCGSSPHHGWFLVGPTASGKTAVAHILARQLGADVLSADSMLVYRGLDIGTAKPDSAMRREVRYWGIDVAEPGEIFSAWRFRALALEAFQHAAASKRRLVIAGGTGLYIKALTHGLCGAAPPSLQVRERWEQLFAAQGVEGLRNALRSRDENALRALADPQNPRRLIRALERFEAEAAGQHSPVAWPPPHAMPAIPGLTMRRETLYARIEERAKRMFELGLLDEARRLRPALSRGGTAAQAIGYAQAFAVLQGLMQIEDAVADIARVTRRLAKRQMTWFKQQANVAWIEIEDGMTIEQIAENVKRVWNENGPVPVLQHGEK